MLIKQIDKNTHKILDYFLGTDTQWALNNGYREEACEKSYNGEWYLKGYAPSEPTPTLKEQLIQLEIKYNMPRIIREGILGNPTAYSEFNVNRAKDLEDLAKKVRELEDNE